VELEDQKWSKAACEAFRSQLWKNSTKMKFSQPVVNYASKRNFINKIKKENIDSIAKSCLESQNSSNVWATIL
jgi:hypothetical protein